MHRLVCPSSEDQRSVRAAKTKGIGKSDIDICRARRIGNVVEITFRIGVFQVDGWRQNLVAQGQDGNSCFQPSGSTEQMSSHGFGRADCYLRLLAKSALDTLGFQQVTNGCRRSMGIDVINV